MGLLFGHRDAPEVIVKDVDHGRGGEQVLVVADGAGVVKHDAAAEAVEVTHQAGHCKSEGKLEELTEDLFLIAGNLNRLEYSVHNLCSMLT